MNKCVKCGKIFSPVLYNISGDYPCPCPACGCNESVPVYVRVKCDISAASLEEVLNDIGYENVLDIKVDCDNIFIIYASYTQGEGE